MESEMDVSPRIKRSVREAKKKLGGDKEFTGESL
jgi:hypothetical protein